MKKNYIKVLTIAPHTHGQALLEATILTSKQKMFVTKLQKCRRCFIKKNPTFWF